MSRGLPTTIALCCFEATARHMSVTQAAEELSLTQSAVSRQIRKLEASLGCQLFRRVKQRLVLTESGRCYAQDIAPLLERLAIVTREVRRDYAKPLQVGAEPSFTTRWLLPRMEAFADSYPGFDIEYFGDLDQLYVTQEGFDIGILYGQGRWSGFVTQLLLPCELVAVCTPSLREHHGVITHPRQLQDYPLLCHVPKASPVHLSSTYLWFHAAGLSDEEVAALPGQRFEHFQFVLDAALHGMGAAVLPRYFVAHELAQGRLAEVSQTPLICGAYYLAIRHTCIGDSRVQAFVDWLMQIADEPVEEERQEVEKDPTG